MKLIGFIKEHNNIEEAVDYSAFKEGILTNNYVVTDIISYLNSGVYLFGWMGVFMDLDNQAIISPDCYYTDGVYVWPAYFPYYIQKYPNQFIDDDFLSHVSENNFRIDETKINELTKSELERELSEELNR